MGHDSDFHKTREIVFHSLRPDQADSALEVLSGLEHVEVRRAARPNTLLLRYDLHEYSIEGIEQALTALGYHFDNALIHKLRRALWHYCEQVQRENIGARPCKPMLQAFVNAWEHHPHGDHDATPEAWRNYK